MRVGRLPEIMRIFYAALILAASAATQTFVVDVNTGPGTNFTAIAAAIAAVPDGAVLEVRPGVYQPFLIQGKSLAVLGTTGVTVDGSATLGGSTVAIGGLASNQAVVLRQLDIRSPFIGWTLSCGSSAGTVLLEGCTMGSRTSTLISSCDRVFVRDCTLVASGFLATALFAYQSNLALSNCDLRSDAFCIRQGAGRLDITDCRLTSVSAAVPGTAIIVVAGGELNLQANTIVTGPVSASALSPAAVGTGTVILDPSTTLQNLATPPFDPNLNVVNRVVPRLDAATQGLGGAATATLALPAAGMGWLFVGFADTPHATTGVVDPVWLAQGAWLHAVGAAPSVSGGYAVPNAGWVLGVVIGWQGATLDSLTGTVAVSNPSVYVHH